MTVSSGWSVLPWALSIIGGTLLWMFMIAIVVSYIEDRRHRPPHSRHHL
jgi:hypothetical protein